MSKKSFFIGVLFVALFTWYAQNNKVSGQVEQNKNTEVNPKDTTKVKGKMNEEANRHELLNASTFQAPRQIQIGLPVTDPGDFLVAENDIPVVYSNIPQGPQSVWRPGDGAYAEIRLMSLTETLLRYGRVGYGTNSILQNGITPAFDPATPGHTQTPQGFAGTLNYRANAYGKQQFDLSLSSPIGKSWYYTMSTYQNFDPGYFKIPYNSLNNRLSMYRASLTKLFAKNKGDITLTYRYAYTEDLFPVTGSSPFLYNGSDKDLSHIDDISFGNDFFGNPLGTLKYKNIKTGNIVNTDMQKAGENYSHNVLLALNYNFKNNLKLNISGRWNYVPKASVQIQASTASIDLNHTGSPTKYFTDVTGSATTDSRYVQQWLALVMEASINDGMLRSELSKTTKNNKLILGLQNIYHYEDFQQSTSFYNTSIEQNQKLLYTQMASGGAPVDVTNINPFAYNDFYLYNVAGSYEKGHEIRTALYAHDTWQALPNLKIDGGVRVDFINIDGQCLPYNFAPGGCLGSIVTDATGNPTTATLQPFSHNYVLPSLALHVNYNVQKNWGLLGEFSFAQTGLNIRTFGGAASQVPTDDQIKPQNVQFGRAGLFFNHPIAEFVAVFTYIEKPKILQAVSTSFEGVPANLMEQYGIKTMGATLDAVLHPFKGFDFHTLVQYMSPKYENFNLTLNDNTFGGANNNPLGPGNTKTFSYSGNTVASVPNWTIELDPSYLIDERKIRVWSSFRYYSKTYGSIMNSIVFQPHWETFGGADWHLNKIFTLGFNVENIFNQSGLSGSVGGSEFLTKSEVDELATNQGGLAMTGSYLRPLTFNFTAQIKF